MEILLHSVYELLIDFVRRTQVLKIKIIFYFQSIKNNLLFLFKKFFGVRVGIGVRIRVEIEVGDGVCLFI